MSNIKKKQVVFTKQANDFIFAQPITAISRMLNALSLLESNGALGMPNAKKIDSQLFEIRVRDNGNQYRVFYCYSFGNLIYVLNGFVKKTKTTPVAEIRKAHAIIKKLEVGQ